MRTYSFPPTRKQLFIAWIDKRLGIGSPSAYFNNGFRYPYAYDWLIEMYNGGKHERKR